MAYIEMFAQNAARPGQKEQPACGPWTLMRLRPSCSMRILQGCGLPGDEFREPEHCVLGRGRALVVPVRGPAVGLWAPLSGVGLGLLVLR